MKSLQNEYLVAKIGVDTAVNEPSKDSRKWGVPKWQFPGSRSIDSLRMQKHSTTLRNQLTNLSNQMQSYEAERQMEIGYLREGLAALRSTLESKGKSALRNGRKPSKS